MPNQSRSVRTIPVRTIKRHASFEQLKKQAKSLHKSIGSSSEAAARVAEYFQSPETATLQQVQLVVAREYGFDSWAKLKAQIPLAAGLAEAPEQRLSRSILKAHDLDEIQNLVQNVLSRELGWKNCELFLFELSVGAAFGIANDTGERCMLKILGPDDFGVKPRRDFQAWLGEQGFPCPKVLIPVSEFDGLRFVIEEYLDDGRHADGHLIPDRTLMAQALHHMIDLSRGYSDIGSIANDTLVTLPNSVWPKPRNVYFDFAATTEGAKWIDDAGAEAKGLMNAMPDGDVLAHMDWSAKHFRVVGEKISVIYDWDSVARVTETRAVGAAAAVHTYFLVH